MICVTYRSENCIATYQNKLKETLGSSAGCASQLQLDTKICKKERVNLEKICLTTDTDTLTRTCVLFWSFDNEFSYLRCFIEILTYTYWSRYPFGQTAFQLFKTEICFSNHRSTSQIMDLHFKLNISFSNHRSTSQIKYHHLKLQITFSNINHKSASQNTNHKSATQNTNHKSASNFPQCIVVECVTWSLEGRSNEQ